MNNQMYNCPTCGTELVIPHTAVREQKARLVSLDALAPKCNWSSVMPTMEEEDMRDAYKKILNECAQFEIDFGL